jgi:hypothetical protein
MSHQLHQKYLTCVCVLLFGDHAYCSKAGFIRDSTIQDFYGAGRPGLKLMIHDLRGSAAAQKVQCSPIAAAAGAGAGEQLDEQGILLKAAGVDGAE